MILKVRNQDGGWDGIQAIKGEKGDPGMGSIDSALSTTSPNPVENRVITSKINEIESEVNNKADSTSLSSVATSGSYNDLNDKPTIPSAYDDTEVRGLIDGKVGFDDYATANKGGVVVINTSADLEPLAGGSFRGVVRTPQSFATRLNTALVSKGTLENVLADRLDGMVVDDDLATVATSGSYNDLDDKPTIPTAPADYIVETGTDGIWTYEKWNSGKAVAWGKHTLGSYSWIAWGSYAIESNNSDYVDFPATLFLGNPHMNCNLIDESGLLAAFCEIWKYDGTRCQIKAVRPKTSSNPSTPTWTAHIKLTGAWK